MRSIQDENCEWENMMVGALSAPQTLCSKIVEVMQLSSSPMCLIWGESQTVRYNEACLPIVGNRHPDAFGKSIFEVDEIESWQLESVGRVRETGRPFSVDRHFFIVERTGRHYEAHYSSLSDPIKDETGRVAGVLIKLFDLTEKIIESRQLHSLSVLIAEIAEVGQKKKMIERFLESLQANSRDLPFMIYLPLIGSAFDFRNLCSFGVPSPLDFVRLLEERYGVISRVQQDPLPVEVEGIRDLIGCSAGNSRSGIPDKAKVYPIRAKHALDQAGLIIFGLNPYRDFDEVYRSFLQSITGFFEANIRISDDFEVSATKADQLVAIDRRKSEFLARLSDEFRTPLSLVLQSVDGLAENDYLEMEDLHILDIAIRNSKRLLKLVNQLRDCTEVNPHLQNLIMVPTDLVELTKEIVSGFRTRILEAGLVLEEDWKDLGQEIYVDREKWESIVLNLLSNALKFTHKGKISIRMFRSDDHAHFSVKDSGVGISTSQLKDIFQKFIRLAGTNGRSREGSGMGLALTDELVKLHGGSITVSSTLAVGSEFVVNLPFANQQGEHLSPQEKAAHPGRVIESFFEESGAWRGSSADSIELEQDSKSTLDTILIVDDNADMRGYLKRILRSAYRVDSVANGKEALEYLRTKEPDLILSDIMMPGIDGIELLRKIRAHERWKTIPLVFLTARSGSESSRDGLLEGADDYVTKPFSAQDLKVKVASQIKLLKVRRESAKKEAMLLADVEAARKSNVIKDEFLATVAHELRTPLNAIYGNCQMLGMIDIQNSDFDEAVGAILCCVETEMKLVDDLINLSRLNADGFKLNLRHSDLVCIVNAALAECSALMDEHQMNLDFERHPKVLFLSADEESLRVAFCNIIANAVRFSEKGGRISMSMTQSEDCAIVTVRDFGRGIGPDFVPFAFDPFRQEDGSKTREIGGLGLGLTIARKVIDNHGGKIRIGSEGLNRGTTCEVTLPLTSQGLKNEV